MLASVVLMTYFYWIKLKLFVGQVLFLFLLLLFYNEECVFQSNVFQSNAFQRQPVVKYSLLMNTEYLMRVLRRAKQVVR